MDRWCETRVCVHFRCHRRCWTSPKHSLLITSGWRIRWTREIACGAPSSRLMNSWGIRTTWRITSSCASGASSATSPIRWYLFSYNRQFSWRIQIIFFLKQKKRAINGWILTVSGLLPVLELLPALRPLPLDGHLCRRKIPSSWSQLGISSWKWWGIDVRSGPNTVRLPSLNGNPPYVNPIINIDFIPFWQNQRYFFSSSFFFFYYKYYVWFR